MIPKLYSNRETNFAHNGIGLLSDAISCFVTEAQNGTYELELTYKVSSFLSHELVEDNIIKAKANEEHEPQLFRIYYVSEEINGIITVRAEHISYDLRGNFVENLMLTNVTCEQAGQQMFARLEETHPFTFASDIEQVADFYNVTRYNGLESVAGSKGSLLDTFGNGAKLVRDNFKISLVKERGRNNEVLISYAKNMTGYTRELDSTDLVTKIYPFAIVTPTVPEGDPSQPVEETVVLPERFINSVNYDKYSNGKILSVDYSSEESVKDIASLRKIATKFFTDTKQDEPNINYQVEFHSLYGTSEYEELNLRELEKVCLDDTVTVRDFRFGRNVEAKVIKTVFDTLLERYDRIELGRFRGTLKITDTDLGDKVDGNINKIKNMYVRFQVLDDRVESEVARLDGDIKTNTSLIRQTAEDITLEVRGLEQKIPTDAEIAEQIKVETDKVNKEIADINSQLGNIEGNITDAIKDGILTEAEIKIIKDNVNQLDKEKSEIDAQYTELYNNKDLT